MGAIADRLNRAKFENMRESVPAGSVLPNNDLIVSLQSQQIGALERSYAAGEISETDYRQRYNKIGASLRSLGSFT